MTAVFHSIRNAWNHGMLSRSFAHLHPCLAYTALFVGAPVCMLLAVFAGTAVIALPFAFLFGLL